MNDGFKLTPVINVTNSNGINDIPKLIDEDIVRANGKIYFGIYTFVINLELLVIEFKHIVVHSLKKLKHTTPVIKNTG